LDVVLNIVINDTSGCPDAKTIRYRLVTILFVPGEGIFSMAKKLYVGNLSYNTTEDGLKNLFSGFGSVASVKIIFDRESGNSKGFGFIEMGSDEEATAAIAGTNGREFDGRQLRVNEAMDKPRRERGGGGNW
jgi:RNA recognition motif-containing protein